MGRRPLVAHGLESIQYFLLLCAAKGKMQKGVALSRCCVLLLHLFTCGRPSSAVSGHLPTAAILHYSIRPDEHGQILTRWSSHLTPPLSCYRTHERRTDEASCMCSKVLDLLGVHLPVAVLLHLLRADDCGHFPQCAGKPLYLLAFAFNGQGLLQRGKCSCKVGPVSVCLCAQ